MRRLVILFLVFTIMFPAVVLAYPAPSEAKDKLKILLPQYETTPKDTKLLMEIGLCYHSIGGAGDADAVLKSIEFFQKTIDIEPNNNEAKAWLGSATCIRARDVWFVDAMNYTNKGASIMDAAVKAEPDNIDVRMTRGTTYLYMPSFLGKDGMAVSDFEFVVMRSKDSDDKIFLQNLYYKLGLAYKKVNNVNKAKEKFNLAVTIDTNSEIAKKIEKEEHL